MEDEKIVRLFWQRNELAIREASAKYGALCFRVAANILPDEEDRKECLNDTWLAVWNSIPPQRPKHFSAYAAKIARNTALDKLAYLNAAKRNMRCLPIDELAECISQKETVETQAQYEQICAAINSFLRQQSPEKRKVFILRYWYFDPIKEIAARTGASCGKIRSMLFNMRKKLKVYLEREGIEI